MLNIKFRGVFENERQLEAASNSNVCIQFEEPEDINALMKNGFFLSLPIIISSLMIAGVAFFDVVSNNQCEKKDIIFSIIFSSIIILLYQFLHEIIHALLFPHKALKEIYVSKDLSSLFVYCTSPVSKIRFIIITIAPNIILGVVPLFTAVLCREVLSPVPVMILIITGYISIVMGIGDYCNIYNAVYQVPAGAYIFNSGLHSYWYESVNKLKDRPSKSGKALLVLLFLLGFILLALDLEICLILFFSSIMVATLNRGAFYTIFKWLSLIAIIFVYIVLLGLF